VVSPSPNLAFLTLPFLPGLRLTFCWDLLKLPLATGHPVLVHVYAPHDANLDSVEGYVYYGRLAVFLLVVALSIQLSNFDFNFSLL